MPASSDLRKSALLSWFVLHFVLLIAISCRETLLLVSHGATVLSPKTREFARQAESVTAAALALHLAESNPAREIVATYLGLAGIDAGYGYFAPNVPNSYRLVFELHYPDGHSEIQMTTAKNGATDLRLASLLDQIGRTPSDEFREYMIKKLAAAIWRRHPDVVTMRASLSQVVQPSADNYERGTRETDELLYAYDFSLAADMKTSKP